MNPNEGFELRPRSIGELLDLSFRIFRSRLKLFAAIGICVATISGLAGTLVQTLIIPTEAWNFDQEDPVAALGFMATLYMVAFVVGLLNLVIYSVGTVAMTAAAEDVLLGRPSGVGDAVRKSRSRAVWAALASILVSFCVGLGALACLVPAIPVLLMLVLAVPLVYLERKGPVEAMGRSYELVFNRGTRELSIESNWVRVLIVGVITLVVIYVISFVSNVPLMIAAAAAAFEGEALAPTRFGPQFLPLSILLPLQLIASLIYGTFMAIGIIPWTVVYYDIRVRHEGLDLELQVGALAAPEGSADGPA